MAGWQIATGWVLALLQRGADAATSYAGVLALLGAVLLAASLVYAFLVRRAS